MAVHMYLLVGYIDTELLQCVGRKHFESKDIEKSKGNAFDTILMGEGE